METITKDINKLALKKVYEVIENVKKPMSINQIMAKYKITSFQFQIYCVKETTSHKTSEVVRNK